MRKLNIILLCAALASGCAWNSPQVVAQRTIQTTVLAKDQAMKAWAVYVVTKENSVSGENLAKLSETRQKVDALNEEFNVSASLALDLALADQNGVAPAKLQKLLADIVALTSTFTK